MTVFLAPMCFIVLLGYFIVTENGNSSNTHINIYHPFGNQFVFPANLDKRTQGIVFSASLRLKICPRIVQNFYILLRYSAV
jgi:hypothetical protein